MEKLDIEVKVSETPGEVIEKPEISAQIQEIEPDIVAPVVEKKSLMEEKSAKIGSEEDLLRERKEKIINFFKKNYTWAVFLGLALITYISVKIRTSNLSGLKDITTNTWTLGPDLDPFLFLRWAKQIVAEGSLAAVDTMRYVPLGYETKRELLLHPYMIAWFHKIAVIFGSESVTQSAVIYPAFMFALTVIAFFFLARKIFVNKLGKNKANIIGLLSAFFLSVIPALLPRTIAGIPEKESAAFLFMFLAFYFFLASWDSKKNSKRYIHAALAGASTAAMALIWGGFGFIFLTLAPTFFFAFLLGKIDKKRLYTYMIWVLSSFLLMYPFSSRYSPFDVLTSLQTGISVVVLFAVLVHFALYDTKLKQRLKLEKYNKLPPQIISVIVAITLMLAFTVVFMGPSFISDQAKDVVSKLVRPAISRLIQTVAESRQPYFNEWSGSFGPFIKGQPVFFWLFFSGSIYLFYAITKVFKAKERLALTTAYIIFLFALVFSRYAPGSTLNGTNTPSLVVYGGGFVILFAAMAYYYYRYYKKEEMGKLREIEFNYMFLFALFLLSIVAARGQVRLIMMLVGPTSMIVSYFVVASFNDARRVKDGVVKIIALALVVLIIIFTIFSGYGFYNSIKNQAPNHIPNGYTMQWQKAMEWVRDNTPTNAVFGHWWDYGYWLQSIGERATVLDGGNAISYWNHLMGRYALTGTDNRAALEYLYAHETTHFLIDSTDIGKYNAFATIGSDSNYDRVSYIPSFSKNGQRTVETKNSTIYYYEGGAGLDENIVYEDNNDTRIFLPAGAAGLGALLIERNDAGEIISNPIGVYVYQGQQYQIPLRYAYQDELLDFGSGLESGVYIFPRISQSSGGFQVEADGAMFYLSSRVVNTQLARLYLFKEDNPNFKLVHSQDDLFVEQIKANNPGFPYDIVSYQGTRGPIRIWEIVYPEDIEFKEEFLNTTYPEDIFLGR